MQHFSIFEQTTPEAIDAYIKEKDLNGQDIPNRSHPQEDYLLESKNPPIFVVADGVTLDFKKIRDDGQDYPDPSPAGKVAQIFCEAIIDSATAKYGSLSEKDIIEIFKDGNRQVEKYNKEVGPSDISGNQTGFYSATGAFVIIKDNKAYWSAICDAYVAHFDKDMNKKFMSTGVCNPYAVINGEEHMAEHLEFGVWDLEPGDRIFVLSDGFEYTVKNQEFIELFKNWDYSLKDRVLAFGAQANLKDPAHYGHERSLIAICF